MRKQTIESPKTKKYSEKTQNLDEFDHSCQFQQFLKVENYDILFSKSKDAYRKCFKLLSETFLIDFTGFQDKNSENKFQSSDQSYGNFQSNQNLEKILSHNEKLDIAKSFSYSTRTKKTVLFILVFRSKDNLDNNTLKSDGELRFLFLNNNGQIINILSTRASGAVEKFIGRITKFFSRLQQVFIFDMSSNLCEVKVILEALIAPKIAKGLIYVSPFSRELLQLSKQTETVSNTHILIPISKGLQICYSNCVKNLSYIVHCQNGHKIEEQDQIVKKLYRYQQIHDFIIQKALRPLLIAKINQKILFTNQWLNNAFSWYFNVVQSLGTELSLEKNTKQTFRAINAKISMYFEQKTSQRSNLQHYNTSTNEKCYPDLLRVTKVCTVCKKRKPKYGCLQCTKKYDVDINLCVESCFKVYHKNHIKYLAKYVQTNQSSNPDKKSTSILDAGIFVDQTQGKAKKNRQLEPRPCVEKNSKYHHPFQRYKTIRKKLKKVMQESPCRIRTMRFQEVNLIDFSGMECIYENGVGFLEQMEKSPSKIIDDSQNSSKIQEEESSQMDS